MNLDCAVVDESFKYVYGIDHGEKSEDMFNNKHIDLFAGKRDWSAFQVIMKADEEFTVSTGKNPCFSAYGPLDNVRIKTEIDNYPDSQIRLYPVGLIEDDDRLLKSDPVLHSESIYVPKSRVQAVWTEIDVPKDLKPGVYKGRVIIFKHSMFGDERKIDELTFNLTVKDVVLPQPKEFSFNLDLWLHFSNIARKHEVDLWSNNHFRVLEYYVQSLSELGQKAVTVIVSEIPWSGQRCFRVKNYPSNLFEYNMVSIKKNINGQFIYDYSVMERYIKLCEKYGINQEIEVIGLVNIWIALKEGYDDIAKDYPDAVRIRYLDESDQCYKYMKSAEDIIDYVKSLEQYFIIKGLIGRVLVAADEPGDIQKYRRSIQIIKETAPSFRLKTAINHVEFVEEFKEQINSFVPIFSTVCKEYNLLQKLRNSGKSVSWYVCCNPPYPNTFICSPLLESRLIGILTAFMNLEGFLRWNYTVWPENPRQNMSYRYPRWNAGDTNFVYPSRSGKPVLTLRYKNLKRGIEDFELIKILEKVHPDPERVLNTVWNKIFKETDITQFETKNPEELYSLEYRDYQESKALIMDEIARYK